MPQRLRFSKELLQQLIQQGYTHIQQRGVENKPESTLHTNEDPEYDYILIPMKQSGFSLEDVSRVLPIDSSDVSDMLDVEFGINFYVELPNATLE